MKLNPFLSSFALYGAVGFAVASSPYEEVVVTATLNERTAFEVLGSASVITEEDLNRFQPLDMGEVLESETGLDISRTGGRLSNTSLFTRGANSNHTLVLINGHRFNSATLGQTQFRFVDPEQIARVEIIRGARSSLYGSDAIGGVVNIITKQGSEDTSGFVSAAYGSQNTSSLSVGTSGTHSGLGYYLALSREQSDGIDSLVDDTDLNSDLDPYESVSGNLFIDYEYELGELALSHMESRADVDYDSAFGSDTQPYSDNKIRVTTADANLNVTDKVSVSMSLSSSKDFSEQKVRGVLGGSEITTTRDVARTFLTAKGKTGVFIAGVEHQEESVSSDVEYSEESGAAVTDRDNLATFVQYELSLWKIDTQLGGRHDYSSSYGAVDTYTAAAGFEPFENVRAFVAYAEGFKVPTFNDLYWPEGLYSLGNPDLKPESSTSRELGIKTHFDRVYIEASIFNNDIINLIEWGAREDFRWQPNNVSSVQLKGSDIVVGYTDEHWRVNASYSRADTKDVSTGLPLPSRADKKVSLDISYSTDVAAVGGVLRAQSERTGASESVESSPGYGTIDLYANYQINDHVQAKIKVDNLLDKEYQYDVRYNPEGQSVNLNVVFRY